jgi:hypothetical protein
VFGSSHATFPSVREARVQLPVSYLKLSLLMKYLTVKVHFDRLSAVQVRALVQAQNFNQSRKI